MLEEDAMQIQSTFKSLPMPTHSNISQPIVSEQPAPTDSFTFATPGSRKAAFATVAGAAAGAFAGLSTGIVSGAVGGATMALPGATMGFVGGAFLGAAITDDEYSALTVAGFGGLVGALGGIAGGYAIGAHAPTAMGVIALTLAGGASGLVLTSE
jgi:hypothetical protein